MEQNDNPLKAEEMLGPIFQVIAAKEVVWEYVNPHLFEAINGATTNLAFRSTHYLSGQVPYLRRLKCYLTGQNLEPSRSTLTLRCRSGQR